MIKIEAVSRMYSADSYGTGGAGFYEHKGVRIELSDGDSIRAYYGYSSQGYGTFKELKDGDLAELNGRMLNKHLPYHRDVISHFDNKVWPALKALQGQEFKNLLAVKRALRNL